eukprot:snap_masked-scaffold_4-processed-gene-12.29-mRNA-1 protein AED:1.00 eAED:1.00 QI:0/-1/0/0/-1/1/1/0/300
MLKVHGSTPTKEQVLQLEKLKKAILDEPKFSTFCTKLDEENSTYGRKDIEEYLDEKVLHRFLCAREYNFNISKKLLLDHIVWYFGKYKPSLISPEEVEACAILGSVHVKFKNINDKYGRPIVCLDNSKDHTARKGMDTYQQVKDKKEKQRLAMTHLVFNLERAVRLLENGVQRYVVFINLEDFKWMNIPDFETTKETIQILTAQYPERLGDAILYNAPRIFESFFSVAKVFIDKVTREKIHFVQGKCKKGSRHDEKLEELLGPNWAKLTGLDSEKRKNIARGYDHKSYWKLVEEQHSKSK